MVLRVSFNKKKLNKIITLSFSSECMKKIKE
jgi:hypothetical protein